MIEKEDLRNGHRTIKGLRHTPRVIGPKDSLDLDSFVVNTTSRSPQTWSRGLSPFYLGPVDLYDSHVAHCLENGWQFSKVYRKHLDEDGTISDQYWEWAQNGSPGCRWRSKGNRSTG